MNKRSAPRFPVSLEVSASYAGGRPQICSVRDYCSGGMYLLYERQQAQSDGVKIGGKLDIEFTDPLNPRSPKLFLESKVTRFDTHGVGVQFTSENASAIIVLSQLAASQAASRKGVGGTAIADATYGHDTVEKLIKNISNTSWEHLAEILKAFFEKANDALFDASGQAGNNALQSAYYGCMNELRKGKDSLIEGYLNHFGEQFEILTTPGYKNRFEQEAAAQEGLTLLGSEELENWLAVRAMSSKLEERMGETLEALETRFEEISANSITLENNPAGPFVIASVFREMVGRVVLEEAPKKLLFVVMEKLLANTLQKLYDELNEIMIASGILPTLQKNLSVTRTPDELDDEYEEEDYNEPPQGGNRGAPRSPRRQPGGMAPPPMGGGQPRMGGGQPMQQPMGGQPQMQGGYAQQPAMGGQQQPMTGGQPSMGGNQPSMGGNQPNMGGQPMMDGGMYPPPGTFAPPPEPRGAASGITPIKYNRGSGGAVAHSAMHASAPPTTGGMPSPSGGGYSHAVQELMRMQRPANEAAGEGVPPEGYYNSGQVMQALGKLDQTIGNLDTRNMDTLEHIDYISNAVAQTLGEDKILGAADQEAVTYVGGMFSSIGQDMLVAEHAQPWFSRLEVPMLKAGILDPSLLEDDNHPARELLNRLEAVGDRLQNDNSSLAQKATQQINKSLDKVEQTVETNPDAFSTAVDEVGQVQEELDSNYEEKIQKLIQQCEQEKEADKARDSVLEALNKRLSQRDVPVVVLHLLDSGWKNLLLRTLVKSGADSAAFQTYLNVVDMLTARLTGKKPAVADAKMTDENLVEWASRMLSMVSTNEKKNNLIIRELARDLTGKSTTQPETKFVKTLIAKSADSHAASKPAEVSDDIWGLMLEDAKHLEDREAFQIKKKGQKPISINLVWRDSDKRFVFADNLGDKALDVELDEIASAFYNKTLVRLSEKDLTVTERAIYSFLQSMHKQIAFQANHDDLTGLLNRKSFETELDALLADSRKGATTHVLGYFDLDRFNIINTTCGHADGDKLLVKVADVLRDTLKDKAIISRLGGDEFGILVTNCKRTEGLKLLTQVHNSIRGIRFACGNNEFKVTCSMGVTEVNETSESYGHLLSAVDSATFTAKENGRDNIQIYNIENERIASRRHILDWVGRINVLFEKNLIQFRCQKIAPLHRTINSLPHYEILLDVHDEEGNKVPLDEFIVAAERYNRILDIDTWVMNYIFDWVEKRKSKLDRISNVSVNLSGSSLGNAHFMDDVYQRLSKPEFPATKICFEVTETAAMSNLDMAARFMKRLKETGCSFALDDFGSGTSSYAYLRSLPIDYLKIDGAFVKDIAKNTSDYAVVKSINEIGHVMGKRTVAEGVEDEFSYQLLHDIGIDFVQGFGVEKPIPLTDLFD